MALFQPSTEFLTRQTSSDTRADTRERLLDVLASQLLQEKTADAYSLLQEYKTFFRDLLPADALQAQLKQEPDADALIRSLYPSAPALTTDS
jgi:hypothetical protein